MSPPEGSPLATDKSPVGHSRKGAALASLKKYPEALTAYDEGLKQDPNNDQLKEGNREVKAQASEMANNSEFPNPFKGPEVVEKLKNDPRPKFKVKEFINPRTMTTTSALLNVDLSDVSDDDVDMETTPAPPKSEPSKSKDEPMDVEIIPEKKQEKKLVNYTESIDPKGVTPSNKVPESEVDPDDCFGISLKEGMFRAVKTDKPIKEEDLATLAHICTAVVRASRKLIPSFVSNFIVSHDQITGVNSDSGDCTKSLNIDATHSHNVPSTSQQGARDSSKNWPESTLDRKRKRMEGIHSVVKAKELEEEQQPSQCSRNLPSTSQQGAVASSRSCPGSKHDLKRKCTESTRSVVKSEEIKVEQRPFQDCKNWASMMLKCKETTRTGAKAYKSKDEHQQVQDSKSKLDSKRWAMALEARNRDKNYIKKTDSPGQSAMLAMTSSKKERTSLYHGGRKPGIPKLKDLCIQFLNKGIKQTSDPTQYINTHVEFSVIEPVLVFMSPEKLQILEDKMEYLKVETDGLWRFFCERKLFKSQLHLKKENENWRTFYQRCTLEFEEKLRNITASISAASTAKPGRQIKLTTVDGPPTKRQKLDHAMVARNNANNLAVKPLPNSCHPRNSRSDALVPPKGISNHIKSSHKIIKKDAPLMLKAKKTLAQLKKLANHRGC